jgi:DNA primase
VLRYQPKSFRQRRPDGNGGWIWNLQGVERLLYNLPQLYAEPQRWVAFSEGEKCADRLTDLGMLSTCIAGGTNGPIPSSMVKDLRSHAGVCIFPDDDPPGYAFAEKIARLLHGGGIKVKVIQL